MTTRAAALFRGGQGDEPADGITFPEPIEAPDVRKEKLYGYSASS